MHKHINLVQPTGKLTRNKGDGYAKTLQHDDIYLVIMAGGIGRRFWPLSTKKTS